MLVANSFTHSVYRVPLPVALAPLARESLNSTGSVNGLHAQANIQLYAVLHERASDGCALPVRTLDVPSSRTAVN